jgi:hypothetical protein
MCSPFLFLGGLREAEHLAQEFVGAEFAISEGAVKLTGEGRAQGDWVEERIERDC